MKPVKSVKPVSYKRVLAYLIDILIVTVITTMITMFIPASPEYQEKANELNAVMESYSKGELEDEEYLQKANDISYVISKETVAISIVTIVLTTIYFVVVAYYMNGQTPGKKIMKLQVVSTNEKKLTINNFLIRSLIIDSILLNIISVVTILFMTKSLYLQIYDITTTIFGAIYIVTFAMILFREDGRGLHDIISKTKVISIENENNSVANTKVVKEIIEEKGNHEEEKEKIVLKTEEKATKKKTKINKNNQATKNGKNYNNNKTTKNTKETKNNKPTNKKNNK